MKEVISIKNVTTKKFLVKFGQEFCIPCEITGRNLDEIEKDFDFPFYATNNVDEAIERGYKNLPVVMIYNDGNWIELTDTSIMMNKEALKDWISNNNELKDATELKENN